ncbi:MAG: TolC family protein [Muribaculaceae bacterium]|nr:TolC family protein [Muribaculaceae bacterium]
MNGYIVKNRLSILSIALLASVGSMHASDFESELAEIEANNLSLKALRGENIATVTELNSGNNIWGSPSVEFSPFFHKGSSGVASYELIVSQEFDFPTLYSERKKNARMQASVLNGQYETARKDIRFSAQKLLLELIRLNKENALIGKRTKNGEILLNLYQKRMDSGEATSLEINRLKMDMMNLNAEAVKTNLAMDNAVAALQTLNGGKPLNHGNIQYPGFRELPSLDRLKDDLSHADSRVMTADAEIKSARQNYRLNRRSWLPTLNVGYRRNYEVGEALNEFLIGASFPIFGNSAKIKAARQRMEAAEQSREAVMIESESGITSAYNNLKSTRSMLAVYDMGLMEQTLELMLKAVNSGRMSLPDYCYEADKIYAQMQEYIRLEGEAYILQAELFKYE